MMAVEKKHDCCSLKDNYGWEKKDSSVKDGVEKNMTLHRYVNVVIDSILFLVQKL